MPSFTPKPSVTSRPAQSTMSASPIVAPKPSQNDIIKTEIKKPKDVVLEYAPPVVESMSSDAPALQDFDFVFIEDNALVEVDASGDMFPMLDLDASEVEVNMGVGMGFGLETKSKYNETLDFGDDSSSGEEEVLEQG